MPFSLRPMTLRDIDAVLEIEQRVYPTPFTRQGYRNELEQNDLARYSVLVSADASAIAGYAGHWVMADEMHISMIAVHPDWQRRGLGEVLLQHELVRACERAATLATLEVREGNAPAQRLYEKLGFAVVGRRKNYYKDTGEAAILMTLEPLDCAAIGKRWISVAAGAGVLL